MQRKCRELKCDRCGETVLLEKTDVYEEYEHDIDIYEDPPTGWSVFNGSDLCPECTKKLEHLMNGFFEDKAETEKKEEKSNVVDLDAVKNAMSTLRRFCTVHRYCAGCPFDELHDQSGDSICYFRGRNPISYDETLAFRE